VLRRVLLGVHESASSGEWSHDGHVVGKASFSWPIDASASVYSVWMMVKVMLTWRANDLVAA
jgi:hypothetical protein